MIILMGAWLLQPAWRRKRKECVTAVAEATLWKKEGEKKVFHGECDPFLQESKQEPPGPQRGNESGLGVRQRRSSWHHTPKRKMLDEKIVFQKFRNFLWEPNMVLENRNVILCVRGSGLMSRAQAYREWNHCCQVFDPERSKGLDRLRCNSFCYCFWKLCV